MAKSSLVADIDYDIDRELLGVELRDGTRIVYFNVPPQLAHDFKHAESKGNFYNLHVRDRFQFEYM